MAASWERPEKLPVMDGVGTMRRAVEKGGQRVPSTWAQARLPVAGGQSGDGGLSRDGKGEAVAGRKAAAFL